MQWQKDRDAAQLLVDERNKAINQTLSSWHRKVGAAGAHEKLERLEQAGAAACLVRGPRASLRP